LDYEECFICVDGRSTAAVYVAGQLDLCAGAELDMAMGACCGVTNCSVFGQRVRSIQSNQIIKEVRKWAGS
jgi:hypothetical protein